MLANVKQARVIAKNIRDETVWYSVDWCFIVSVRFSVRAMLFGFNWQWSPPFATRRMVDSGSQKVTANLIAMESAPPNRPEVNDPFQVACPVGRAVGVLHDPDLRLQPFGAAVIRIPIGCRLFV
jgi:hypothetical protein